MPELGILPNSALSIPALQLDTRASYFDRTPLPVRTPDTSALSRAQGKAALFGSIADTLSKLPETLMTAYQAGKKMVTGNKTIDAYNAALAGNPVNGTSLADFKATGDGAVTFNQDKPEDAELRRLKIEALKRQGVKQPSFYDQEAASATKLPVGGAAAPTLPGGSTDEPTLTADPNDPDNLDYVTGEHDTTGNTTPAASSLFPPGETPTNPKPKLRVGPVPLSQLSEFQPSPQVAPQDVAAIQGAAINIGNQLSAVQPDAALAASTGDTGAPSAAVEPVSREQALATFAESQPTSVASPNPTPTPAVSTDAGGGFSQEQTGSKTIDPATGVITLKTSDGREYVLTPGGHGYQEVKPKGGAPTVPAMIRSEAIRMGVYKDGMTAEEVAKAMEDKQITDGVIPPHLLPQASSLARLITQHPTLKHYPTIREAKEAVDAGLKNPDTGGFSDMALVEGFQRMVNPGATVRAQTINSMMDAAGFLQKLDPSFLWNKAVQGDKFSPEARLRIKKLADDIYERATKNAEPQLKALGRIAKSYGISKPEDFVNNVLVMSPLFDAGGSVVPEGTPGAPAAPAPAAVATPKDAQAATWAKANPTDPRAAAIKAAQQAKGIWVD